MRDRSHAAVRRLILLAMIILLSACGKKRIPIEERIRNTDEIITGIRQGLKDHAAAITIRFSYGSNIYDDLNAVVEEWVEAALAETGDPTEGDYIRYQYGGYTYNSSYVKKEGRIEYTVVLTPIYYAYLNEEVRASEEAEKLLSSFELDGMTGDLEKIRTVYRWICENVRYDRRFLHNPDYHLNSTAFAALVQRLASCQGYCTALYRLLRSGGVPCRIVTGTAKEEGLHAWMFVLLDGKWYQMDPTWDAEEGEYRYFLGGTGTFSDHTPGEQFLTDAFLGPYPLSEEDYPAK